VSSRLPRVVIVGCGFGGLFAARALKRAPIELLLIDRHNYHLFQPLLYQVASAALAPAHIAQPIRTILRGQKNALVMLGLVEGVAPAENLVRVDGGRLHYDYLILAPGAVENYFGHPEWAAHARGLKDIDDGVAIRSRLLMSFETAEIEADPDERVARLTFVIIGGGPTGVELAGAIKELAVNVVPRDFRNTDTRHARVILIEAGDRLLPALHPSSSRRALTQLRELGVEVSLGRPVTAVSAEGIELGAERLRSYNVLWAAGVRASPLVASLNVPLGPGARVNVNADCSVPGHSRVFVIGDAAHLIEARSKAPVPGVSQGAMQMGRYVARIIREEIRGKPSRHRERGFHYLDYGAMATIGKWRAVVELRSVRFGGLAAWLAWLALHVTVLIGFRNRLAVLASWIYEYVFRRRGARLITGLEPEPVKRLAA
jgi:NADH:ubiquinone reductase (H+-translocating)